MSDKISLQAQLDEVKEAFLKNAPDDAKDTMMNAHRNLADSGLIGRAIKKGAIAPDFALPNAKGATINLKSELANGPVILKFYRGVW
mgnify:CR=1 FL=1